MKLIAFEQTLDTDTASSSSSGAKVKFEQKPTRRMKQQRHSSSVKDCGWAWIVLLSTLLSKIIIAIGNTSGLYSLIFHELYGESAASIAFALSMQRGLGLLVGPLVSLIYEYIGAQKTMILGGSIAALGFVISYCATNFHHILIGYGMVVGIGYGLCYVPGMVILGFYFEIYRGIAFGIATTAPGIAMLIFGPFVQWLIDFYGWRGSLLILAGVSMEMLVCGMVMVKPYETQRLKDKQDAYDIQPKETIKECSNSPLLSEKCNNAGSHVLILGSDALVTTEKGYVSDVTETNVSLDGKTEIEPQPGSIYLKTRNLSNNLNQNKIRPLHNRVGISCACVANHDDVKESTREINNTEFTTRDKSTYLKESLLRKYVILISDPWFWLFNLGLFCIYAGLAIFHLHFPGYVVSQGSTKMQSSILLSLNGGAFILSGLGTGALSNSNVLNNRILFVLTSSLTGCVLIIGTEFCSEFAGQAAVSILVGLVMNSYNSLMSPITIDVFGLENYNAAYGIEACVGGCGYLAGPPFAGWLYDITSSYQYTFYIGGGLYVFSGICVLVIHFCKKI